MGTKTIMTNNKELYKKLNMLHLVNEVVISNTPKLNLNKIMKNINRKGNFLSYEKLGKYIVIKKMTPFSFNVYHKPK